MESSYVGYLQESSIAPIRKETRMKSLLNILLGCGETVALANGRGYFVELSSVAVGDIGYYDTAGKFYTLQTLFDEGVGLHFVK